MIDDIREQFSVRSTSGYLMTMDDEDKKDIELHKIQLNLEKEKELHGAEAEIKAEADKTATQIKMEDKKKEITCQLNTCVDLDPAEREKLLAQLQALEDDIARQMAADKAN